MIIEFSAEPYLQDYSLTNFHTGEQLDKVKRNFSEELNCQLKQWYKSYQNYTSYTLEELEPCWEIIDDLDKQAKELLENIKTELSEYNFEKIQYYSLCRDNFHVLEK